MRALTFPLIAVASTLALVALTVGAPRGSAELTASAAIGCEFLADAIDGSLHDVTLHEDLAAACDGVSATEVGNLANVLGDADGTLEATDLQAIDLDANQIREKDPGYVGSIHIFAFVDDDELVIFDAQAGVATQVNSDAGGPAPNLDTDSESCAEGDDADCDTSVLGDGDGVVVATISTTSADAGDEVDVDVYQGNDSPTFGTQTLVVVGFPDNMHLSASATLLQAAETGEAQACLDTSDVADPAQADDPIRTVVQVIATDDDDVAVTRVPVTFTSSDGSIAAIDDDSSEVANDPKATTGLTVQTANAGIAALAVVCGVGVGQTTIEAAIPFEDESIVLTVVAVSENIELVASPPRIDCADGTPITLTAYVTDASGAPIVDGTVVTFSVLALGTAEPLTDETAGGLASSEIVSATGNSSGGVTVIVSTEFGQSSIRIECAQPVCADVTGDGRITGRDVAAVARGLARGDQSFDVNGDGEVTMRDLKRVIAEIGSTCAASPPL